MALASMYLEVWSWSRQSPELQTGKERSFKQCERGMVVGVWVFPNLLSYWDFHTQPFLGITKNGVRREKHPVCGSDG